MPGLPLIEMKKETKQDNKYRRYARIGWLVVSYSVVSAYLFAYGLWRWPFVLLQAAVAQEWRPFITPLETRWQMALTVTIIMTGALMVLSASAQGSIRTSSGWKPLPADKAALRAEKSMRRALWKFWGAMLGLGIFSNALRASGSSFPDNLGSALQLILGAIWHLRFEQLIEWTHNFPGVVLPEAIVLFVILQKIRVLRMKKHPPKVLLQYVPAGWKRQISFSSTGSTYDSGGSAHLRSGPLSTEDSSGEELPDLDRDIFDPLDTLSGLDYEILDVNINHSLSDD